MKRKLDGKKRESSSERGVILLLACFAMPVLVSMLGLGIDLSVIYSIKARLQMACDGATVAGVRALSLAQDSVSQSNAASDVAKQWFNANFGGNQLGAYGTSVPVVVVTDDNANRIRSVSVTASTKAPTYFMKYWGRDFTLIGANAQTSRRDVVIMMVLDRSGSMNTANNSYGGLLPCQVMVNAAKQFTGMFQQNRDKIGLVTFAETGEIVSSPIATFQSVLGYTNSSGATSGAIDNITCNGWTNTSTALSVAYNELYKNATPGALNIIVLFTDGTPTALTLSAVTDPNFEPTHVSQSALLSTSTCLDGNNVAISAGGNMVSSPRNWINRESFGAVGSIAFGPNSFPAWATVSGPYAAYRIDSGGGDLFFSPGAAPNETSKDTTEAKGCGFLSTATMSTDFAFIPPTDIWGNATDGYHGTMTTMYQAGLSRATTDSATVASNMNNAVFNAADAAANFARTSRNLPGGGTFPAVQINAIGLGGNGGVDFTFLQRVANDPTADPQGNYGTYSGYNQNQPVGQFIYSPDASQLQSAFTRIGSMILRISR